jgi:two-component system, OmpR family, aerobic respiration control sensor histidine kinase ArcB
MRAKDKISVLFVEDNSLAKKLGVLILEELDCKVDAVSSGAEAIKFASRNFYQIIFMDIGLPDMDGVEVIKKVRGINSFYQNVPIVSLTAHSDKEYIAQSFEAGASEFLVKPLSHDVAGDILKKYFVEAD